MQVRDRHRTNKAAWNEASTFYQEERERVKALLKGGGHSFSPKELKFIPNLAKGKVVLHLQCAAGEDTLSFINMGAKEVIGLDISDKMIQLAQEISQTLQMNARWYNEDVINLPGELYQVADLVYTGKGAIPWIMDLEAWGRSVVNSLKPRGNFYLFEGHPFTFLFDVNASTLSLDKEYYGYFSQKIYSSRGWTEEYVGNFGKKPEELNLKYERVWPISEIITTLLNAGLKLLAFEEYPDPFWQEFPHLPDKEREKIPNTFCLLMSK